MARHKKAHARRPQSVVTLERLGIPHKQWGGQNRSSNKLWAAWRCCFAQQRRVWRFGITFFGCLGLFYVAYALVTGNEYIRAILRLTALMSAWVLRVLGYEPRVNGTVVTAPCFAFEVVRGCDGLEPVGFLLAATLATPSPFRMRCEFAIIGTVVLLGLNLARLVSLALLEAYFPDLTETAHWGIWPAVTIVAVVAMWFNLLRRTQSNDRAKRREPA